LAQQRLKAGCALCVGADFTGEGNVGSDDLLVLAENWLAD
jgi:hypothetical protein